MKHDLFVDGEAMSDDMDRLEARMRDLWEVGKPLAALANEDRAVAEKLLGKAEAHRLAATKSGDRFRYRPQSTQKIEYHYVHAWGHSSSLGGWTIEATQNGVRRELGRGLSDERCNLIVCELVKRGYRVEIVLTEAMKHLGVTRLPAFGRHPVTPSKPKPDRSQRFAIMDRLMNSRLSEGARR
ncbi:hypothetical protein [Devosia sp.]|uniref:hypothetical protein n=1 Tax=Devosia sp. TaxID=1871048 RepID=UPI001AC6605A|nr:hypothetical protein [Devosia sp.]MBN9333278.1 hypothetical protein [Devosia sp.]